MATNIHLDHCLWEQHTLRVALLTKDVTLAFPAYDIASYDLDLMCDHFCDLDLLRELLYMYVWEWEIENMTKNENSMEEISWANVSKWTWGCFYV